MTLRVRAKPDVKWGPRPGPRVGLRHGFAVAFVAFAAARKRALCLRGVVRTVGDRNLEHPGSAVEVDCLCAAVLEFDHVSHGQVFG